MSEELVKINTDLSKGGVGFNFDSQLFALKPATLTLNQGQTQAEGATPGMFRINETGEEFKKMTVALLVMPTEARSWYIGEKGALNKRPENLMCFAREPEKGKLWKPDERSKQPQALTCASCSFAMDVKENWNAYYENGEDPKFIPECSLYYYAIFIDTVTQSPLKMFIQTKGSKDGFKEGMQVMSRLVRKLNAEGKSPNIWDFTFDMYSVKRTSKKGAVTYALKIDGKSVKLGTPEEQEKFGQMYLNYVNRGVQEEVVDTAVETNATINTAVEEITI